MWPERETVLARISWLLRDLIYVLYRCGVGFPQLRDLHDRLSDFAACRRLASLLSYRQFLLSCLFDQSFSSPLSNFFSRPHHLPFLCRSLIFDWLQCPSSIVISQQHRLLLHSYLTQPPSDIDFATTCHVACSPSSRPRSRPCTSLKVRSLEALSELKLGGIFDWACISGRVFCLSFW